MVEIKGVRAEGTLTLRVKDYDTFGSDDDIGELVISLKEVMAQASSEGAKPCWKKLTGVGAGEGELCVGFEVEGGVANQAGGAATPAASFACQRVNRRSQRQHVLDEPPARVVSVDSPALLVYILRAKNLTPSPDIGSLDPSAVVSVGDTEVQTAVVQDSTDPG